MSDHLTMVKVRWKVVHASPRGVRHPGDVEDVSVDVAKAMLVAGLVELADDGPENAMAAPAETPERPARSERRRRK